jgi:hypothetical protein
MYLFLNYLSYLAIYKIVASNESITKIDYRIIIEMVKYQNFGLAVYYSFLSRSFQIDTHCRYCTAFPLFHEQIGQNWSKFLWWQARGYNKVYALQFRWKSAKYRWIGWIHGGSSAVQWLSICWAGSTYRPVQSMDIEPYVRQYMLECSDVTHTSLNIMIPLLLFRIWFLKKA